MALGELVTHTATETARDAFEWGGLVLFEFLVILALASYAFWLTKKLFSLVEKVLAAFVENTKVISEFKELLKDVIRR